MPRVFIFCPIGVVEKISQAQRCVSWRRGTHFSSQAATILKLYQC